MPVGIPLFNLRLLCDGGTLEDDVLSVSFQAGAVKGHRGVVYTYSQSMTPFPCLPIFGCMRVCHFDTPSMFCCQRFRARAGSSV